MASTLGTNAMGTVHKRGEDSQQRALRRACITSNPSGVNLGNKGGGQEVIPSVAAPTAAKSWCGSDDGTASWVASIRLPLPTESDNGMS